MATQLYGNVQSVLQQGGCDMATPAGLQPPLPPDQLYGHVQSDLQQGGPQQKWDFKIKKYLFNKLIDFALFVIA